MVFLWVLYYAICFLYKIKSIKPKSIPLSAIFKCAGQESRVGIGSGTERASSRVKGGASSAHGSLNLVAEGDALVQVQVQVGVGVGCGVWGVFRRSVREKQQTHLGSLCAVL